MKINKKIRLFIAFVSLIYLLSLIQNTYAKYTTSASANADITIARWNVLINDQDIINDSDFSKTLSPVFTGNSNMRANIIAPTAVGYFDIILDGTNTDVSYKYTFTFMENEENTVKDLKVTSYSLNDDSTKYDITDEKLEGTCHYDDENKTYKFRFYLEWVDEDGEMDNEEDTKQTVDGKALFNVNVNIIQLADEIITTKVVDTTDTNTESE